MSDPDDPLIIDLQSRLAYAELTIEGLSDEIARQRTSIEALGAIVDRLSNRLDAIPTPANPDPEPPPPHY